MIKTFSISDPLLELVRERLIEKSDVDISGDIALKTWPPANKF